MNNAYAPTIFKLVEYEIWCNLQALDFLGKLPEEELKRDFGFGLRSLHRTMFHIASVMRTWSSAVGPVIDIPEPLPYDADLSLVEIRTMLVRTSEAWLAAAQTSHEHHLLGRECRLNQLFHLITHGTHHRGQLLSMLTLLGYEQPFEGGDFGGWSKAALE